MNSQPKGVEMEVAVRIHTVESRFHPPQVWKKEEKKMSYAFPSRLPLRLSAEQPILMHLHDKWMEMWWLYHPNFILYTAPRICHCSSTLHFCIGMTFSTIGLISHLWNEVNSFFLLYMGLLSCLFKLPTYQTFPNVRIYSPWFLWLGWRYKRNMPKAVICIILYCKIHNPP